MATAHGFHDLGGTWRQIAQCSTDCELHGDRVREQRIDLARTIASQAQAIADGTLTGPQYGAVRRLLANAEMLVAWTADDRSGSTGGR
jgi:hypothetical protein